MSRSVVASPGLFDCVPSMHRTPIALLARLKERGVVGAARHGNLRLAVHFYNHEDDIDQVARVIAAL